MKLLLTRHMRKWKNNIKTYITGTARFDDWKENNRMRFNYRLFYGSDEHSNFTET